MFIEIIKKNLIICVIQDNLETLCYIVITLSVTPYTTYTYNINANTKD